MNAVYWGLMSLCILDRKDALPRDGLIEYVMKCWDEEQGQQQQQTVTVFVLFFF